MNKKTTCFEFRYMEKSYLEIDNCARRKLQAGKTVPFFPILIAPFHM